MRAVLEDAAFVEDQDVIAARSRRHAMGDEDHGTFLGLALDGIEDG